MVGGAHPAPLQALRAYVLLDVLRHRRGGSNLVVTELQASHAGSLSVRDWASSGQCRTTKKPKQVKARRIYRY